MRGRQKTETPPAELRGMSLREMVALVGHYGADVIRAELERRRIAYGPEALASSTWRPPCA
jgi:hypothetical protein